MRRGNYVAFLLEATPQILCEKCARESKFFRSKSTSENYIVKDLMICDESFCASHAPDDTTTIV
jgi:hypothetical protein